MSDPSPQNPTSPPSFDDIYNLIDEAIKSDDPLKAIRDVLSTSRSKALRHHTALARRLEEVSHHDQFIAHLRTVDADAATDTLLSPYLPALFPSSFRQHLLNNTITLTVPLDAVATLVMLAASARSSARHQTGNYVSFNTCAPDQNRTACYISYCISLFSNALFSRNVTPGVATTEHALDNFISHSDEVKSVGNSWHGLNVGPDIDLAPFSNNFDYVPDFYSDLLTLMVSDYLLNYSNSDGLPITPQNLKNLNQSHFHDYLFSRDGFRDIAINLTRIISEIPTTGVNMIVPLITIRDNLTDKDLSLRALFATPTFKALLALAERLSSSPSPSPTA